MIYEQDAFLSGLIKDPVLSYNIIDLLPFPINYRDAEGFYITCNKAFEKLLGISREEVIGKSYLESQPAEVDEMMQMKDKELFDSPTDIIYEHQFKTTDGTMHEMLIYKTAIRNDSGAFEGIVSTLYDVSDRRKAELRSEKAKEASVIASAMLQKIRAGIVIVDHNMKVIDCNETFARLMGEEAEELYKAIPGLQGADVKELVPEIVGTCSPVCCIPARRCWSVT